MIKGNFNLKLIEYSEKDLMSSVCIKILDYLG